jgi:hypothetical protein
MTTAENGFWNIINAEGVGVDGGEKSLSSAPKARLDRRW